MLVGAALLGPHMRYVGKRVEAIEAEQATQVGATAVGAAAPAPAGHQGQAAGEGDDVVDEHVLEIESVRTVPRQPCIPDVDSAFRLHAAT